MTNICSTATIELRDKIAGGENIREYFEASTLPTREEARAAQKICCGRVCSLCESPAEYAWRKRTVDLATLVKEAVEQDLDDAERLTIEQYWFENMTLTQIAAETGRAPPNVARTLERAHKKLFFVLRHVVQYQYNLESADFTPLAVRKAIAVAAAEKQKGRIFGERLRNLRVRENIQTKKLAEMLAMCRINSKNGIPGVLAEFAFLDNAADRLAIDTDAELKAQGEAYGKALVNFLMLERREPENQAPAAGAKLSLSNVYLYASASASSAVRKITGEYWLYDGILIVGRYRITNRASFVGKKPVSQYVTGWIDAGNVAER